MRLFGKKKDKKTAQGNPMETRMAQQEAYFEIVKQIAPDDPEVLLALREGFSHPEAYADRYRERLQKEYWLEPERVLECVQDQWWLMLDILQWCSRLDEKLAERNLVVGNIDTESDAYAVFFVPGKNWLRCSNLPAWFTTGFILRKTLDSKQKTWTKLSRLF